MNQYDVIVIGAGPAGSTAAALMARAGQRVLLLEKSVFPRHKLCGEFITPECGKVFDRLGVSEKMHDAGRKSSENGRSIHLKDAALKCLWSGLPMVIRMHRPFKGAGWI
ncbi:MAG: FAD-dependent monooxygenase [Acidobacteria bacterium]|nr:FAD-dependent monooxygenase [Acidobacteriota bacterium]